MHPFNELAASDRDWPLQGMLNQSLHKEKSEACELHTLSINSSRQRSHVNQMNISAFMRRLLIRKRQVTEGQASGNKHRARDVITARSFLGNKNGQPHHIALTSVRVNSKPITLTLKTEAINKYAQYYSYYYNYLLITATLSRRRRFTALTYKQT